MVVLQTVVLLLDSRLLSLLITWMDMPGLLGALIMGGKLYSLGFQTRPSGLVHQGGEIASMREQFLLPHPAACLPIDTRGHLLFI